MDNKNKEEQKDDKKSKASACDKNAKDIDGNKKELGSLKAKVVMTVGGMLVGLAGGFFGGGGGMLCVPLLDKVLKVETKRSHATAMLVILPMSIASALAYFFTGHFRLFNTLMVGSGVMAGGIVGALLLKKLNPFIVALVFSILMIAAGVKLIFF